MGAGGHRRAQRGDAARAQQEVLLQGRRDGDRVLSDGGSPGSRVSLCCDRPSCCCCCCDRFVVDVLGGGDGGGDGGGVVVGVVSLGAERAVVGRLLKAHFYCLATDRRLSRQDRRPRTARLARMHPRQNSHLVCGGL